MMNLDEILKGIGQQMSQSLPNWNTTNIQPQIQAPEFTGLGPWGQAASGFQSSYNGAPATGFGSAYSGSPANGFSSDQYRKNLQQDALAHTSAARPTYSTGTPASSGDEVDQYIQQAFSAKGHDPLVASKVYHGEGASKYVGDDQSSFGPFQLHYGNVAGGGNAVGGLGDAFTRETGLDARDPSTWKAQVDWVANNLNNTGWGPWHAAAKQGVGPRDGIATRAVNAQPGAAQGQGILSAAQPFMGSAYHWGGKSPQTGFDCSGLAGYLLTGQQESTRTLYAKSVGVAAGQEQPGDLVFYHMGHAADDEHVAVSIGNGQIVQAGGTQHNVNVSNANQFTAPGWQPEYRRLT